MNTHPQVSFFRKLYLPASEPRTLEEIIILIRIRHWMHEITAYRNALAAGNLEGARKLKTQLPGFTPSGVFRTGHRADQLETYSHTVGLDFDHVSDPPALARLFREQKYTLGLFISPGGEGLKVFVLVDTDRELHLNAFTAVATWYEQLSGLSCDRVCKDISRCCYVSDDPDAWYNPDAETFVVSALSPVQLFAQEWLHRHPMAEGNRNQTVYRLGCEANRKGFSREEVAAFCIPLLHAPGFTSEEIDQALSSAYEGNKGERSVSPATFRTQKDKKDTGTFSGEELRRNTPFLPGDITEHLPPLLGDALRFYTDRRERDMAFLAACTVLSACLPGVWGVYNRKRVYPHLYTVEVASAANGKGCINDMRHLADRYASLIEIETKRKEDEYLQALEEWELKKAESRRTKKAVSVTDAPREERTCYFYIPTQITKAKLLVHLSENGDIGGLMADSEIDTLISAGKQDYGLASRLLLYTCRSEAVWQDVSSAGEAEQFELYLGELSERVLQVAMLLRKRRLQVRLTPLQWQELNVHFERLLRETDLFGSEHFLSVVKRHGLMAYRLCMLFTALDAASLDYGVDERYCSAAHFRAALSIVDVCLEHSRLLMTQLEESSPVPELTCPDYFRKIFEQLPEQFTLSDLYALTQAAQINDRTVRRHLSRLEPQYITRLSAGVYSKKTPPAA